MLRGVWRPLEADLSLLYFGMRVEKLFYLCGVDVLPSSDDQVFDASLYAAVAQTVQTGDVSENEYSEFRGRPLGGE